MTGGGSANSFLLFPNLCPSRLLSLSYPLASGSRNGSLLASCCGVRFAPLQVDSPEGGQGGRYAVEFVLQSHAFLLELADYRVEQRIGHEAILSFNIPATLPADTRELLKLADSVTAIRNSCEQPSHHPVPCGSVLAEIDPLRTSSCSVCSPP